VHLAPILGSRYSDSVRVFNRSTVRAFGETRPEARQALAAWFAEVERASWQRPQDVQQRYASASILKGGRVVFNIQGNKYRVVVAIRYEFHAVYIRFVGTHAEYDAIDAETI
jgi:mRNA interferase HigB